MDFESKYSEFIQLLKENKISIPDLDFPMKASNTTGESFVIAYSIQGLLKYHGMSDNYHKIAYFPSISLNNDASFTITYVKFSKNFSNDRLIFNGNEYIQGSSEFNRVKHQLDNIRKYSQTNTKALIISRNFIKKSKDIALGKGLGTSAAGGAAIAHASINILNKNNHNIIKNFRLRSIYARYLAGSASRSSVGGIGLWFSHSKIDPMDCFAIRLDRPEDKKFIDNIDLITISIPSDIKTNQAHEVAPRSPFFKVWQDNRKKLIKDFCMAFFRHDFEKMGILTEYDTLSLHSVTMTADHHNNIIAWSPVTLLIMHLTRKLRKEGISVYFSIDTGPSVVLLTKNENTPRILKELENSKIKYPIIVGKIAGPSKIIDKKSLKAKLLSKDIKKFNVH